MADEGDRSEKLQKALARSGVGSRRSCEVLIAEGRVSVNGEIAQIGRRVDPHVDIIEVDASVVNVNDTHVYYLLNKLAGVVSTADDPQGRPTVVECVPTSPRVFPVGRLDTDTEGLLILTNDGDITHRLTHPSFGVDKEYLVQLDVAPSAGALRTLREGVELDDGVTIPAKVGVLDTTLITITIHEGRNRQVRRMCSAIGCEVVRLVRTRIGTIADSKLAPGDYRLLSADEVRALERSIEQTH